MPANLYATLRAHGSAAPSATFIETPDGRRWSYADLDRESGRIAALLVERGARPGDRVLVQCEKSPPAVFLYFACVRAGLIYLPVNTGYRPAEIDYFLKDAEPRLAVGSPGLALAACAGRAGLPLLSLDAEGEGDLVALAGRFDGAFPDGGAGGDDLAAIVYTSGTTGRPKGAMLTHRNLASNALALHRIWGFRPDDVLLHALPIFHVHGLFVAINCSVANGTGMLFLPRFDPEEVTRLLPRVTVMMGVPTYYVRLLARPELDADLCRNMRLFISGSAPLPVDTFESFRTRTGHAILERYGMTECGMITSNPLQGPRLPGTVGLPLPGVEIRVCDGEGRALPAGEIGAIEVRGPNVFKGYWGKPDSTREEFRSDGFFRTGDVGVVDAAGYLRIVGRSKDLIITGGLNVYPKEVEAVLDAAEGVQESAVIGVPHPDFGEAVVAVVAPRPGQSPAPEALLALARDRLAAFKAPKRIIVVDSIPRNVMGKVEKARLRETYRTLFQP